MLSQVSPSFTASYVLLQLAAVTAVPCIKQGKVKPRSQIHTLRNEWQRKEYKRHNFREHGVNDSGNGNEWIETNWKKKGNWETTVGEGRE